MKTSYSVPINQIKAMHQALLKEFLNVLVDLADIGDSETLNTMAGHPVKIHLHFDAQAFNHHIPNVEERDGGHGGQNDGPENHQTGRMRHQFGATQW